MRQISMLQRNSIISPEDDAWSNRKGKRISVIEYCQSLTSVVRRERLDGATVEFAAMARAGRRSRMSAAECLQFGTEAPKLKLRRLSMREDLNSPSRASSFANAAP